jgi:NADPH2:quinone reductase
VSYGHSGTKVVVTELGETPPDAIEHHLELVEQPPPDPANLGPKDVVVAVRSATVGWVDLIMTSGQYQHMAPPPYTPGLEYGGEVVWVGSEVTQWQVGDAVINDGFVTGPRSKGGYQKYGGFASYAVAPEDGLMALPPHFGFDQGCNLLGNYETAYHCLVARGRLQEGETVLIHGASGATGLAAVHIAKILGATVIATGRSLEKLEIVKEEGADHVICTAESEGGIDRLREAVRALTDGKGADVVYDGVGGEISVKSLRCVRFGARYLIVGWAATPFVAKGKGGRGAPNANVLPTNLIMMKGLDVLGCPTVISTGVDPSIRGPRLQALMGWAADGLFQPRVSKVFPFGMVRDAMMAKWRSEAVGGIVLHPPAP